MGSVNRASPLPLWAQIADDLRRRVAEGEFEERFSTDAELSRHYGVSRQTIRESVRHLEADGLVVRRRGRGTTLSRPMLEQPLNSLYSLASTVRAQGLPEHSEVISAKREPPSRSVRDKLSLGVGEDVLYVERLRFAGEEPISWDRSWLPWPKASSLLKADLAAGSLYDAISTYCGLRITGGWERIRPVVPGQRERRMLQMSERTAAFSIERLAMAAGDPVEWRRSLVRGDGYCLLAQWPAGTAAQDGAELGFAASVG